LILTGTNLLNSGNIGVGTTKVGLTSFGDTQAFHGLLERESESGEENFYLNSSIFKSPGVYASEINNSSKSVSLDSAVTELLISNKSQSTREMSSYHNAADYLMKNIHS